MKKALSVLALGLAACGSGEGPGPAARPPLPGLQEAPARTATARREVVPLWREVPSTVRSLNHIQVSSEITARVLRVHAETGQRVHKGDLLAELDPSSLLAAREAALAALDLARAEEERARRLHEQKVVSDRELDAARTALRRAEADLRLAETNLAKARIVAPVDAVVEGREVGPGDLAVPGRPLYLLYDPRELCHEAHVPVGDREFVALGTVLPWRLGDQEGEGPVSEVAPSSDPRSRTVRIRVPLPPGLKVNGEEPAPGTFGTLRYRVGEREQISVPVEAVQRVGELEMVLVREDGGWERRMVRTGAREGDRVEILSGLEGGEEVGLP